MSGSRGRRLPGFLGLLAGLLSIALLAGACDSPPDETQPTAGQEQTGTETGTQTSPTPTPTPKPKRSGTQEQGSPEGKSFTFSAGSVTVRRVGFDTLRILDVTTKDGWRRTIDDDFDDSVGVDFFKGQSNVDFTASLDNGRLTAEACQNISRLSSRPSVGDAAVVALQRIGDEDLHISVVRTSPGWQARITDNNSEDVEALFLSKGERLDFDAQLDDGRLEGTICKTLG